MQYHIPINKRLSYGVIKSQDDSIQQNQQLIVELERSTQLLNNSIEECGRLKSDLTRYKALYDDNAHKTSNMKDTISQLVGEIEKLNNLISSQDQQILMGQQHLKSTCQQLDEQKYEKAQLLKILKTFQNEQAQNKLNGANELIKWKSENLEKELKNIKLSYQDLTVLHKLEITQLKEDILAEKKKCVQLENQILTATADKSNSRVQIAVEKLEKQLLLMGNLVGQKQIEIDQIKKLTSTDQDGQLEDLQGQVQHFKDLHKKTQQDFNLYRQSLGQKEPPVNLEKYEQEIHNLKKQMSLQDEQNEVLQVQFLYLSQQQTNEEAIIRLDQQNQEISQELKRTQDREQNLEKLVLQTQDPTKQLNHVSDERLTSLLAVVQSLQLKNEQLMQYLNTSSHTSPVITAQNYQTQPKQNPQSQQNFSPPRSFNFIQNNNTSRKELNQTTTTQIQNQRTIQQARPSTDQIRTYSPQQMYHRSNPSINPRYLQFNDQFFQQ